DTVVVGLRAPRGHVSPNVCGHTDPLCANQSIRHLGIVRRHFSGTKPMDKFPEFSVGEWNAGVTAHALMSLLQNKASGFCQNEADALFEDRCGAGENNARFLGNEANGRLLKDFNYFRRPRCVGETPNGKVRSTALTRSFFLEARPQRKSRLKAGLQTSF